MRAVCRQAVGSCGCSSDADHEALSDVYWSSKEGFICLSSQQRSPQPACMAVERDTISTLKHHPDSAHCGLEPVLLKYRVRTKVVVRPVVCHHYAYSLHTCVSRQVDLPVDKGVVLLDIGFTGTDPNHGEAAQ